MKLKYICCFPITVGFLLCNNLLATNNTNSNNEERTINNALNVHYLFNLLDYEKKELFNLFRRLKILEKIE